MRLDAIVANGASYNVASTTVKPFAGVSGKFTGGADAYLIVLDKATAPAANDPAVMSWPLLAGQPFSHLLAPDYYIPTAGIVVAVSTAQDKYTDPGAGNNCDLCVLFEKGL